MFGFDLLVIVIGIIVLILVGAFAYRSGYNDGQEDCMHDYQEYCRNVGEVEE